jgi:hypothetical protein
MDMVVVVVGSNSFLNDQKESLRMLQISSASKKNGSLDSESNTGQFDFCFVYHLQSNALCHTG